MNAGVKPQLQVVIDFVNTRDLETGDDALATAAELSRWLTSQGLPASGVSTADLELALELREALRAVMREHNEGAPAEASSATLESIAARGELSVRFRPDGSVAVEPRASGFAGTLAQLLVPVTEASTDGTWKRVKACRDDECQWAFYDGSRNRSGRWCDMAVCGNRTKVRSYRGRRASRSDSNGS